MAEMVLGKQIYRSLEETIRPEHTGLIIVDIQNDFCKEEGHWAKQGKDISHVQKIIPGLVRLITGARKAGVPIIYLQNAYGGSYYSPSFMAHMLKRWDNESQLLYTLEGTWGHQIIDEIKPEKTDFVVKKHRPSGFFGTDLDLILRNINRKTIIVTGCVTEGCVESTARDGWMRDYYVTIAEDCVASGRPDLHNAQLTLMNQIYHFVSSSEKILKTWGVQ